MNFDNIPAGKDIPNDIYVAIEIPANSSPVKYEIDKDMGAVMVDRFMSTPMFYPANYGFIPNTLADDGDPLDVLVVTPYPVIPGSIIRCRAVGMLDMDDEAGGDEKLVAVPHDKLSTIYQDVKDVDDLPQLLKDQIQHFFENYKDLEKGKWASDEMIDFEININDTSQKYHLVYTLRNSLNYPYYNLYLKYKLKDSIGSTLSENLQELILMDKKTGKPFGSGFGDMYDH